MSIVKTNFFETTWDKIVFTGSVLGLVLLLFISLYGRIETRELKKENAALKEELKFLKEKIPGQSVK